MFNKKDANQNFLNCSWKDRKSTETVGFKITVSEQQQIISIKEINAKAAGTVIILLSAILCEYPPPPQGKVSCEYVTSRNWWNS